MAQQVKKMLSIRAVADHLDVSIKTIRRWIKCGDLLAFKVGGQWRIDPDDLERFLWRHRRSMPGTGGR